MNVIGECDKIDHSVPSLPSAFDVPAGTPGVVTDETVCVGAGSVVAGCDTTSVTISGPGKAFAETTCGVLDDPVWRLSLSCFSSIKFSLKADFQEGQILFLFLKSRDENN